MSRAAAFAGPPQLPGYTYLRPLGEGGYSDVYLYERARPRMEVAVKVLRELGGSPGGRSGGQSVPLPLSAEADLMAQVSRHPYMVTILDADTAPDGRQYIVMEYYPGDTMARRAKRGTVTVGQVLRIGIQLCGAVETAHRFGIIHRDIKPANVLTDEFGHPKLTDFGIAGKRNEESGDGGLSIPWSPPEVIRGHTVPDELSDVYSLAATLWNLLAGRSPFEVPGADNSALALSRRIETQPVPWIGREDVPQSLERVLQQAMAKDPAARHASALQLARALQAVQQELGQAVVEPEIPEEADSPQVTARGRAADRDATQFKPHRIQAHRSDQTAARDDGLIRGVPEPGRYASAAPGQVAAFSAPADPIVAARQGIPELPAVGDTVARPSVAGGPAPAPGPAPGTAGPRWGVVAAVLGVALAVTAGVVVYSRAGQAPGADAGTPVASPTAQDVLAATPPDPPKGSAVRSSLVSAHFVWSVADPTTVTFFVVRRSDPGAGTHPDREHVSKGVYDLTGLAVGDKPCLEVQSGNGSGATSAPVRICLP